MNNKQLIREKLAQATQILDEFGVDLWLTLVRETSMSPDPALELIAGVDMTWQSAFMVSRNGRHTAIVGFYDGENVRNLNAYEEVVGYHEGIGQHLLAALKQYDPGGSGQYFYAGTACDGSGAGSHEFGRGCISDG